MKALDRAIKHSGPDGKPGNLRTLAKAVGVCYQSVQDWRRKGIPAERVLAIEAATKGAVKRHELRPDIYPVGR